jgi:hypothetical protein
MLGIQVHGSREAELVTQLHYRGAQYVLPWRGSGL